MGVGAPILVALAIALLIYAGAIGGLMAAGLRIDARALVGFCVACVRLLRRLLADPRVARRHKLLLAVAVGYLLLPVDVVPDFIPVAGYLDDVLVVALSVRLVLRQAGPSVVSEHWTGPADLLPVLLRLAGVTLRPGTGLLAWTTVAGALGLAICVWFDIADNCASCGERDPLLLSAGRGAAVALCALGVLGLAARALSPGRSGRTPPAASRRS
jgi:uncharacterized membrane protein YkvA (DUF1232 family)